MKLRIEVSDGLPEDEVIIRCGRVDQTVQKLQEYVRGLNRPPLTFFKGPREFYPAIEDILFFETDGERVYAHTADDAFRVKYRLYELEAILPHTFSRAAKGTVVNTSRIFSISRNLASSSLIRFADTHKQIYVSRHYFKSLKKIMTKGSAQK